MSLNINEFTHLVIVRSGQMTSNALADHRQREAEHERIEREVDEYLRRGGSINIVESADNTGRHQLSKLTNPESDVVTKAVKNLRSAFGNNLDIKQDMESGKYKAFYKGEQLGNMKTSLSKAETAIRCEAIKSRNNLKKTATNKSGT